MTSLSLRDPSSVAVAIEQDRDLGEIARWARRRAGEDDVVHAPAAQRLGARFAHCPADRLEQVGLAAAVRADDPGQARLDPQLGRLDEALEAAELEPPNPQPSPPLPSLPAERLVELRPSAASQGAVLSGTSCR